LPALAPATFVIRSLVGDLNVNGTITLTDSMAIRSVIGQGVTAPRAVYDLDLSGDIDMNDVALSKSLISNSLACP
jgi:hypothetical protein